MGTSKPNFQHIGASRKRKLLTKEEFKKRAANSDGFQNEFLTNGSLRKYEFVTHRKVIKRSHINKYMFTYANNVHVRKHKHIHTHSRMRVHKTIDKKRNPIYTDSYNEIIHVYVPTNTQRI